MKKLTKYFFLILVLNYFSLNCLAISSESKKNNFIPVCARSEAIKLYFENYFNLPCQDIKPKHLVYITYMNLSFWGVSELLPGDFSGLSELIELNLRANDINYIDEGALAPLEQLLILNLSNNKIRFLNPNAFITLKNLITLDLSNNEIYEIQDSPFKGLKNLKQLDIYNNCVQLVNDVIGNPPMCLETLSTRAKKGLPSSININL